jgi:hypothetical protein
MFGPYVDDAIMVHAREAHPKEACGIVLLTVLGNAYVPCENVAEEPERAFKIEPEEYARHLVSGKMLAVVHSHTDKPEDERRRRPGLSPDCPTKEDMVGQIALGLPWGVCLTNGASAQRPWWWGDHLLDVPLERREFRHGVMDCFALARAYYWQKLKVRMKDFPREDAWWIKEDGKIEPEDNLYATYFRDYGFRRLPDSEVMDGRGLMEHDCFLGEVLSTHGVPNHGGMYLGRGEIIHHIYGQVSRRTPVSPYMSKITHWLRYEP